MTPSPRRLSTAHCLLKLTTIAVLLVASACRPRAGADPQAGRPGTDQFEPDESPEPADGGPRTQVAAPVLGRARSSAIVPRSVPTELLRAAERARDATKLAAEAARRSEIELNLRAYDEAGTGFEACVSDLGQLFARLPEARRYRVPERRGTAQRLLRDCQAGLARLAAEKQAAGRGQEKRVRAQLEKQVEAIAGVRKELAQARRLIRSGSADEIDGALSSVINGFNQIVARYDAGFKSFPDLKDAATRAPAGSPRGKVTMAGLRDEVMREGERVARERSKLRAAGEDKVRRGLRGAMRGLSPDQRKVVEQHLALPDDRKRRAAGGVCFVYRRRDVETVCFDKSGKLVPGS